MSLINSYDIFQFVDHSPVPQKLWKIDYWIMTGGNDEKEKHLDEKICKSVNWWLLGGRVREMKNHFIFTIDRYWNLCRRTFLYLYFFVYGFGHRSLKGRTFARFFKALHVLLNLPEFFQSFSSFYWCIWEEFKTILGSFKAYFCAFMKF